jgi:mercuric ion binding protein
MGALVRVSALASIGALATAGALAVSGDILAAHDEAAPAQQAQNAPSTQVCTLKVSGMTCAGCEAAVRIAARSVDGVKDAKVSYAKGEAEVVFDPARTTPDAIARAITEKSGFTAEPVRGPQNKSGK